MYGVGGVNAVEQRIRNRSLILRSLLVGGPSTRQQLAGATGLTGATISRITDELLRQGLLRAADPVAPQAAAPPRKGRPVALIDLAAERVSVGSLYVAGRAARLGLHDARGAVIDQAAVELDDPDDAEAIFVSLAAELGRLADRASVRDQLIRVGATVLGGVDEKGVVVVAHPDWHDVPAAEILTRELGVPVVVDRMQHGLVTAEAWLGAGAGVDSVAVLDVSDGIGAAIAIGGRVITGYDYREGQLGHFAVPGIERLCQRCGTPGCLQQQIRDRTFAEDARRVLGEATVAGETQIDEDLAVIERLHAAARGGSAEARRLVEERARYIGYALALVTAVVDPELIVLSGPSVIQGWDLIEPTVAAERILRSPLPDEPRHSRIQLSSFGHDAVLVGTASLALQHFYTTPELPLSW